MNNSSRDYIKLICSLYGDRYDDREEDCKPKGLDWEPGMKAVHKSLSVFQKELKEKGIRLSRSKIQKILIAGNRWTTERSREVQWLFEEYTKPVNDCGKGLDPNQAISAIAKHLEISTVSVIINLPYGKVVYDLEDKSANARRIDKCRARKK